MRKIVPKYAVWLFALVFVLAFEANAAQYKPIVLDSNYSHDKWVTKPKDIVKQFRAYTVSFDSPDDDVSLGVPEWVAHEIKPHSDPLGKGPKRPKWIADPDVNDVPTDDSYKNSMNDRGHMCQKYIAWRLGTNADWNTHTTLLCLVALSSFELFLSFDWFRFRLLRVLRLFPEASGLFRTVPDCSDLPFFPALRLVFFGLASPAKSFIDIRSSRPICPSIGIAFFSSATFIFNCAARYSYPAGCSAVVTRYPR